MTYMGMKIRAQDGGYEACMDKGPSLFAKLGLGAIIALGTLAYFAAEDGDIFLGYEIHRPQKTEQVDPERSSTQPSQLESHLEVEK